MDGARIALAALATLGSGIVLGLAANPTLRTFREADWRARYRSALPAPPPAPQPGVSYYGDGSGAWANGGAPPSYAEHLDLVEVAAWDEPEPPAPPPPPPALGDEAATPYDAEASAAARAAAQAAVTDALARSAPRTAAAAEPQPAAAEPADSTDGPAAGDEGLGG